MHPPPTNLLITKEEQVGPAKHSPLHHHQKDNINNDNTINVDINNNTNNNTSNTMCRQSMEFSLLPSADDYDTLLDALSESSLSSSSSSPTTTACLDPPPPPMKRNVRFADSNCFFPSTLEKEQVRGLWFNRQEIAIFRHNNRRGVFMHRKQLEFQKQQRQLRKQQKLHQQQQQQQQEQGQQPQPQQPPAQPQTGLLYPELAETDTTTCRGLESCTMERQVHKHMTIQCTISAHQKGFSPEQTALISQQCSVWNARVAYEQACHDYFTVYQPHMVHKLRRVSRKPPKFPFVLKRKTSSTVESSKRKVRRRAMVG